MLLGIFIDRIGEEKIEVKELGKGEVTKKMKEMEGGEPC